MCYLGESASHGIGVDFIVVLGKLPNNWLAFTRGSYGVVVVGGGCGTREVNTGGKREEEEEACSL